MLADRVFGKNAAQGHTLAVSQVWRKSNGSSDRRGTLARKIVWVEQVGGVTTRIFRSQKLAFQNCEDPQARFKNEAVGEIRRQVYDRQSGCCLWCGKKTKWDGSIWERFHMHEVVSKGKGGDVSLTNSIGLCPECHLQIAHGDRRPRFGERD